MQTRKPLRSVCALLLTLAMLAGMLSVMGALPAAAQAVETFSTDFSVLKASGTGGKIELGTDTDTIAYLEERFDFYYQQEDWYFQRPDVNGHVVDANGNNLTGSYAAANGVYLPDVAGKIASNNGQWIDGITQGYTYPLWYVSGKYLYATGTAGSASSKTFRNASIMYVKGDDGYKATLDNFHLEMDFKFATTNGFDSVAVVFRANDAGNLLSVDQQILSIAPNGYIFVGDYAGAHNFPGYTEQMTYNGETVTFNTSTDYRLVMTVVGTKLEVAVKDGFTILYRAEKTVEDLGSGYLGITGSNSGAYFANIAITRLDKDGNAVDFNDRNDGYGFGADFQHMAEYRDVDATDAERGKYYEGAYYRHTGTNTGYFVQANTDNLFSYTFNDETYATDKEIVDYLNEHFNFYGDRERTFIKLNAPYENSVVQDPDATYGAGKTVQWTLQNGTWLNAVFTGKGSELFRKAYSMVPKTADGNAANLKNLVTEFDFNMTAANNSGLALSFRSDTEGRLNATTASVTLSNKVTLVMTAYGFTLYDGGAYREGEPYYFLDTASDAFIAWSNTAALTKGHAYIRLLENRLFMKITGPDGTVYYDNTNAPLEVNYAESGYMYYSVLNGTGGFADIRIDRLNADGSVAAWSPTASFDASLSVDTTASSYDITAGDGVGEYLSEKFDAYYDLNGTLTETDFVYPTAEADRVGAKWVRVFSKSYLQCLFFDGATNNYLEKVGSLVPKLEDGSQAVLKNFELSFTTRWAEFTVNNSGVGAIVIGLRQQTAGKFTTGAGALNKEQGLIIISPNGISIAGGEDITDTLYGTADQQKFDAVRNDLNWSNVTVRVIGNAVTVTINNDTYTGTVNYDKAGYLALGIGGCYSHYQNIKITRLDENGNMIDWNEQEEKQQAVPNTVSVKYNNLLGFSTSTNKFANSGQRILLSNASLTLAQRDAFVTAMNARFDAYYNDYDGTTAVYRKQSSIVGNTVGYNYNEMQWFQNVWLRCTAAATGYGTVSNADMRQLGSLVVKDNDGEQLFLKNFKLYTAFEQEDDSATGSNIIAFRQVEPGRYYTDEGATATGSYIQFSNGIVKVVENGVTLHTQECTALKPASVANVTLEVVGNTLTYTIESTYENGGPYTGTVALNDVRYGYIAFTVNNTNHFFDIGKTEITALDDDGNETPIKDPASNYPGGNITVETTEADGVYTHVITAVPNEGFELQAGSLLVSDADGNVFVPTRENFRNGGNGLTYVVKTASPITVNGSFIQPSISMPNIGNIGTSVNESLSGLRFVSRFNRLVKEGVEYVILDGDTYPVKDYGMLVGLEMVIGNETLDLALAESNQYIVKASIHDKQVYYDQCDDYIDMSVCVVDLENLPDGLTLEIVSRPYVIVDDGSADGIPLYADTMRSTYEKTAGIETTSFTELFANEQVIALGRAGMVEDEYQMDWTNTGFEVSGELVGTVKVKMVNNRNVRSLLNVTVDGGEASLVYVPIGSTTVTLATNLKQGQHTIEVTSGTSPRFGTLSAVALQYIGKLDTLEEDNTKLRMAVFGDSLSTGWGMSILNGVTYTDQEIANGSNAYYSYAGIAAREMDAYLEVVALEAQTIPSVHEFAKVLNRRSGAPAWDWANDQQDLIVVALGTNDYLTGSTTMQADTEAILSYLREQNPDAYIIFMYGMQRTDGEAAFKAAVASLDDDKMFTFAVTPDKDGYQAHADAAANAANAAALTAFIKENCPELFGHTAHTETLSALEASNHVLFNGRTTASGTTRTMLYNNTGITLAGYLGGKLTMDITVPSNVCALNVVVDGDTKNVQTVWVPAGSSTVTLADLHRGYHTVEITKGTAHNAGTIVMKSVSYFGTLTTPTAKALQIEVIGDSVTVGEGMDDLYANTNSITLAKSYNAFNTYSAQLARKLDAGLSVVAQCGETTADMQAQFLNWSSFESNQKDIVVINLGTNDGGWPGGTMSDTDAAALKEDIAAMLTTVRGKYPDAQIIWAYGLMFYERNGAVVKEAVETFAATDAKVHYCDLSAVGNNNGYMLHPDGDAHTAAAGVLYDFIQNNYQ